MPTSQKFSTPKYRHFRPKNLGVVRLSGHDHYLGEYGSPASYEKYHRFVAEWLANGYSPPDDEPTQAETRPGKARSTETETRSGDDAASAKADKRRTGPELATLQARLNDLTTSANTGHPQALANLRHFLDEHPEVVAHVGDLSTLAEQAARAAPKAR